MMSYGFQLLNDSGEVIADDSSYPLVLIASGSITTGADGGGTINFPDYGQNPIVMIQSPAGGIWVNLGSLTASAASVVTFAASGATALLARVAATFNYRVYARSNLAPTGPGEWGIQVFDAAGQVTFDSRQTLAAINSVITVATPAPTDVTTSLTWRVIALPGGAGSSCWFSLCGGNAAGFQQTGSGQPPGNYLYTHAARVSGTDLQVAYVALTTAVGGNSTWTPARAFFIIN